MDSLARFCREKLFESKGFTWNKYLGGLLLSLLCGLLLSLSFPTANLYFLAWFFLAPLILIANRSSLRRAWGYSFLAGLVYWLMICYWMKAFHELSLITAIPTLALYFSMPFLVTAAWEKVTEGRYRNLRPLIFAMAWVGFEYLRSTGFLAYAWGLLGYSQSFFPPAIQIADFSGVWGVSFVLVFWNASLAQWLEARIDGQPLRKATRTKLLPALILVIGVFAYGSIRLMEPKPKKTYHIALLQACTDPATDWQSEDVAMETMAKIENLSRLAAQRKVDLIIWSETLMARSAMFYYKHFKDTEGPRFRWQRTMGTWFRSMAQRMETDMVLTAPHKAIVTITDRKGRRRRRYASFNSSFFFKADGTLKGEYRKVHLVPFGEWFPFKQTFPWIADILRSTIASNFLPGKVFTVFDSGRARFATVICFEDIFGYLCREFILRGADFLINVTNDYWSRSTKSQEQHFAMAVFRAVENRRYMVRAANTGVSSIIDPWGRVEKRTRNYQEGVLDGRIALMRGSGLTLYTRLGNWLGYLCSVFFVLLVVASLGLGILRSRVLVPTGPVVGRWFATAVTISGLLVLAVASMITSPELDTTWFLILLLTGLASLAVFSIQLVRRIRYGIEKSQPGNKGQ